MIYMIYICIYVFIYIYIYDIYDMYDMYICDICVRYSFIRNLLKTINASTKAASTQAPLDSLLLILGRFFLTGSCVG